MLSFSAPTSGACNWNDYLCTRDACVFFCLFYQCFWAFVQRMDKSLLPFLPPFFPMGMYEIWETCIRNVEEIEKKWKSTRFLRVNARTDLATTVKLTDFLSLCGQLWLSCISWVIRIDNHCHLLPPQWTSMTVARIPEAVLEIFCSDRMHRTSILKVICNVSSKHVWKTKKANFIKKNTVSHFLPFFYVTVHFVIVIYYKITICPVCCNYLDDNLVFILLIFIFLTLPLCDVFFIISALWRVIKTLPSHKGFQTSQDIKHLFVVSEV